MTSLQNLKIDLNIESPFIKVVQECIVKTFKSHKKFIEKEVSLVINKINQIKKTGSSKGPSHIIESLDQLITKLNQTKTKYNKLVEAEDYLFQVMKKRLSHLHLVNENQGNPEIMKDYFMKRLNRIIIDYLLRENYYQSAKAYIDETGLKDFVDLAVFEEINLIQNKLKQRDCSEALNWCNTHKTKLQKSNSQLEFRLRVQEFIELLKKNDLMKAIDYAKKQLSKFDQDPLSLQTLHKIMGLVAFRAEKRQEVDNFKYFVDEARWNELQDLFLKESFNLFGQPQTPLINQSLQTGISVLKTEFCAHDDTFNEQCPTCSVNIRKLGQKLPFSHQAQTSIVCKVTGELMNDQNQPLYLPSGYIVSERALDKIKDPVDSGMVICPFTERRIGSGDIRKVFFS